jgi:hypothetical protein
MKKLKIIIRKYSLLISLIVVLAIIGVGVYINKKIEKEVDVLEEEIKTKYVKVQEYESAKEAAPSPQLIKKLEERKYFYQERFHYMRINFSTSSPVVPVFELYPSVEFKEYLYFSEDRLYKKAKKRNVILPASLGFPTEGLPPEDQIQTMALQFEVIKNFLSLILDSGVTVVNSVTPGVPKKVAFYQMLPLKTEITGTSNEIIRCLKYLGNPSSYFIVERFSVSKIDEDLFNVIVEAEAIIIETEQTNTKEVKQKIETVTKEAKS